MNNHQVVFTRSCRVVFLVGKNMRPEDVHMDVKTTATHEKLAAMTRLLENDTQKGD